MGFVKPAEEIERIEAALVEPRFGGGQMLAVEFLSDPDFIAAVVPPPLEPLEEPRMRAMVGRGNRTAAATSPAAPSTSWSATRASKATTTSPIHGPRRADDLLP